MKNEFYIINDSINRYFENLKGIAWLRCKQAALEEYLEHRIDTISDGSYISIVYHSTLLQLSKIIYILIFHFLYILFALSLSKIANIHI